MAMTNETHVSAKTGSGHEETRAFITGFHGIRYQVTDVDRAVAFYTERLVFMLQHAKPPAFASV